MQHYEHIGLSTICDMVAFLWVGKDWQNYEKKMYPDIFSKASAMLVANLSPILWINIKFPSIGSAQLAKCQRRVFCIALYKFNSDDLNLKLFIAVKRYKCCFRAAISTFAIAASTTYNHSCDGVQQKIADHFQRFLCSTLQKNYNLNCLIKKRNRIKRERYPTIYLPTNHQIST